MKDNRKILSIIAFMIFVLVVKFKDFLQSREIEKAHVVRWDNSQERTFLSNAKESLGVLKIWLFRTDEVVKLFGNGYNDERVKDSIDRKVIKNNSLSSKD